jgi:hypothetical protein
VISPNRLGALDPGRPKHRRYREIRRQFKKLVFDSKVKVITGRGPHLSPDDYAFCICLL